MEPRIQYVKTSDGVNIAYAVFGTGPAIVYPSSLFGTLHLYKSGAGSGGHFDELVSLGWSVITYDARGTGSSDRDTNDWTLTGRVRDVEAVVEKAAQERFALCGSVAGGPAAIAYTVGHPDRVSHLILSNTYASGSEWYELVPAMRLSQRTLGDAEKEWEFATLTIANALTAYTDSERARRMAEAYRTGMTPSAYIAHREAAEKVDVRHMLPQISVPTIVIHDRTSLIERIGVITQRLAPLIPNARFVETESLAAVMDEFLREGGLVPSPPPASAGKGGPKRGIVGTVLEAVNSFEERDTKQRAQGKGRSRREAAVRTILFTDIVGHTEMMQRLGDERGREVLREHERITREVLKAHGGTEVKTMGDGFMASFGSVTRAVECAVALQKAIEVRNRGVGTEQLPEGAAAKDDATAVAQSLRVRIGLNAGEPIEEEGDLFGSTVILASRIAGKAEGGEVLCSDVVRGLCSGKGFLFADRGEFVAKGFEEPVRVYEVRWRE